MNEKKIQEFLYPKYKIDDEIEIQSAEYIIIRKRDKNKKKNKKNNSYRYDDFVEPMKEFCGKKAKIIEVMPCNIYRLDIDGGYWYWTKEMFK